MRLPPLIALSVALLGPYTGLWSCASTESSYEPPKAAETAPPSEKAPDESALSPDAPPAAAAPAKLAAQWAIDKPEALATTPIQDSVWLVARQTGDRTLELDAWIHTSLAMGAAFRMQYDASLLEFEGHQSVAAFGDALEDGLEMSRLMRPGLVAWGGARFPKADASNEGGNAVLNRKVLGTLRFRLLGEGLSRVDFAPEGRELRRRDGEFVDVTWIGGALDITHAGAEVTNAP